MRFTADDILNQRFKTKFQGLDKDDVMTYLELVAEDFEAFQAETAKLREQLGKQDKILIEYKKREDKLRAYVEALSKERKNPPNGDAVKKGDEIIQNALNRAKEIKELTEKEIYEMEKEILILEKHKKSLIGSIK